MAIFMLLFYGIFMYCIKLIAEKFNQKNSWFAFIPILNMYILCKIINRNTTFFYTWLVAALISNLFGSIFCFIVYMGFWLVVWIHIVILLKRPPILGYLMIIPGFNIFVVGYLAFSKEEGL